MAIRCVGIAGRWAILGKDWCCDLRFRGKFTPEFIQLQEI
jgi:hypothetical protein